MKNITIGNFKNIQKVVETLVKLGNGEKLYCKKIDKYITMCNGNIRVINSTYEITYKDLSDLL